MGWISAHGWIRFTALLLIFTMGILNIVFPRKLLKMNLLPWFLKKRFRDRQDRKAVWIVRIVGGVMILFSIMCFAYFVCQYRFRLIP